MIALVPTQSESERLAVDDGEDVDQLHCTMLYLGEAADIDDAAREAITGAVADIADGYGVLKADGFSINLFNPDSPERDPCITLGLSGVDLADLHDELNGAVEAAPDQHRPWIPHVTLIYTDNPAAVADLVDRAGPVEFDRIRVAFGDVVEDYQLGGSAPVTAAAGADVTPGHDELHHYWVAGKGRERWIHSPTPWTTLVALLTEHVGPAKAKIYASRWFIETHGYAAGSDKNRVAHGHPPRGHNVGPG